MLRVIHKNRLTKCCLSLNIRYKTSVSNLENKYHEPIIYFMVIKRLHNGLKLILNFKLNCQNNQQIWQCLQNHNFSVSLILNAAAVWSF